MKIFGVLVVAVALMQSASAQELEKTFKKTCGFCHVSGVAGAPKVGDKTAWDSRMQKGMASLVKSVVNGKGAMPPKGLCSSCGNEDYRALIKYMAAQK